MGAAGILLCQWVVGRMSPLPQRRLYAVDPRDFEVIKVDVADLAVRLHSVDARLDFTEQLLGGALSGARPPAPLPPSKTPPEQGGVRPDADAPSGRVAGRPEEEAAPSDAEDASSDGQGSSPDAESTFQ